MQVRIYNPITSIENPFIESHKGILKAVGVDEKKRENSQGINELLQNIFKVVRMCAEEFEYEPSYFYSKQEEICKFPVYSNILITEGAVVLFTDDLIESIILSAPEHVTSFREKYNKIAADKPKLIYVFKDLESLLDNTNRVITSRKNKSEETEYYYSSLPCLIPILTKEIIINHLHKEVIVAAQDKDNSVLKKIYKYIDSIRARYANKDFEEVLFFSIPGIRYFLKTGRFAEVPPELYSPLTEETRRKMIFELSRNFSVKYRILKKELSAPEGMLSIEVLGNSLLIVFYVQGKGMCFFDINEPGILLAFRNFFKNFSEEEIFSEQESKDILYQIANKELGL